MSFLFLRITAVFVLVLFTISIIPQLGYAEIYLDSKGNAKAGIRIPFGSGSNPSKVNYIEKLKEEETGSAGVAIGLIILGACIVAAVIIAANAADDIVDKVDDKVTAHETKYEDKIDELTDKYDDSNNDSDPTAN